MHFSLTCDARKGARNELVPSIKAVFGYQWITKCKILTALNDEMQNVKIFIGVFRVCLVPHFSQIFLDFGPSFLQNRTKHHAKFLAKKYPFSILDFGLER
jgi:hypothetical protein